MATIDVQDLRKRIRHFRVLIMGRANAGKTTILQKVCSTTDQPEIYDTKGQKIDAAIVKSSIKRGNHNIMNEMVFKSNPVSIFHDSCGFEAGSEEEFENMKKFISERAHVTKLEERIHAIWYCIPMDDPCRTFQRSEEKFFLECDTGRVPVVAIFTKFEALRPFAYGQIKKELKGVSSEEHSKRIAQCVEELFAKTCILDRLCNPENRARPKSYVRLQNMNQQNTNCNTLLESTTLALDDEELRLCLVSTQQSNLELCIQCAITILVDRAHQLFGLLPFDHEAYQYQIARWFPHLKLWYDWNRDYYVPNFVECPSLITYFPCSLILHISCPVQNDNLFNEANIEREDIIRTLQPLAAKGSLFADQIIQTGIATIIVLEYSAFLPKNLERVKSAVDYYLKSPTAVAVEKGAKEICRQGYDREELRRRFLSSFLKIACQRT